VSDLHAVDWLALKKVTAERNVINARREDLQARLRDHIDDSAKQNAQLDACNVA